MGLYREEMLLNTNTASPRSKHSIIDMSRVGQTQIVLVALCLITLVVDGLDLQLLSFAAPPILAEWGISEASLGPAMAAALVGMALGNGAGGWMGDHWGRRPVLIISVVVFGAGTLATAFADNITTLILLRFICGLGFGAAVPSIMALVVEWLPSRLHGPAIGLLAVSTPMGGIVGAVIASWLLDEWGWRACFIASGAATLLLAIALLRFIPESPAYLFRRGRIAKARALLASVFGPVDDDMVATVAQRGQPEQTGASSGVLGRENLRTNVGFSLSLFANSFAGYGFISWTPVILYSAGMVLSDAIRGSFFFNLFAIAGAFGGASIMRWLGSRATMMTSIALSLLAIGGLIVMLPIYEAFAAAHVLIMTLLCLGGIGVGGLQGCNYALSAVSYSSSHRSSGIGLVSAAGRVGGIVAVLMGGVMLALEDNTVLAFFGVMGLTLLLALIGVLTIDRHMSAGRSKSRHQPLNVFAAADGDGHN